MKKIAYIVLASILLLIGASTASHLLVLNSQDVYFGVGTYASASDLAASESEKDGVVQKTDGKSELAVTVMAITANRDGKILKCEIDCVGAAIGYSDTGAVSASPTYMTKRELGYDYGMSKYGIYSDFDGDGRVLEWFEQADAFKSVVVGKGLDEVEALLAEGGRGNSELITAGCTIAVSDFIYAFDNARKNLKLTEAKTEDEIALGIYTASAKLTDATADKGGSGEINVAIFGATVDNSGKVTSAMSDSVAYTAAFDNTGKPASDSSATIKCKRELAYDYGMSVYGIYSDLNGDGVVLEWFEQADVFDSKVVGLTSAELPSLVLDTGYGKDILTTAGCTINVSDFVKSANKALAD